MNQPPFLIRLTAGLWFATGAAAIVFMIGSLIRKDFTLDPNILGLFFGHRLLKGKASFRSKGMIFFVLFGTSILLGAIVMLVTLCFGSSPDQTGGNLHRYFGMLQWPLTFLALCSKSGKEWFASDSPSRQPDMSWAAAFMFAGLCFAGQIEVREFYVQRQVKNLFHFDIQFHAVDAHTGAPISHVGIGYSGEKWDSKGKPLIVRHLISSSRHTKEGNVDSRLYGYSTQPIEIEFSKKGYYGTTYRIDKDSSYETTLRLEPVEPK